MGEGILYNLERFLRQRTFKLSRPNTSKCRRDQIQQQSGELHKQDVSPYSEAAQLFWAGPCHLRETSGPGRVPTAQRNGRHLVS